MPEYLFTWPVFNSTLLWALALHFADLLNNQIGNYFQRFLIILSLHLILFGLLFILKKLFFDNMKPLNVPLILFLVISLLGVLRGVVLQYLLVRYNSATDSSYALRMWASFLNTTSSFVIATITLANIRAHYSTRSRLLIEKNRLEYVQESAQSSLASVNSDVINQIRGDLIAKIQQMYSAPTSIIMLQIKNLIDTVVRPLSKSLDEKIEPWTPPVQEPRAFRVNWAAAFKESIKPTQINYTLVPSMMCVVAIPTILQRSPIYIALLFLPTIAAIGSLWGYLIHRFIAPHLKSRNYYFLLTLVNGAVMGLLTLFFHTGLFTTLRSSASSSNLFSI